MASGGADRANPSATWVHRTLCPAYVLGGAKPEARRSLEALRRQYPHLTVPEVQQGMPPLPQSFAIRSSKPSTMPACRYSAQIYFDGIATLRPMPSGRGAAACAFATA
jgi:hypothetical protein